VVFQDHSERDALARMRMEFVANASHELRTPLAVLSGFIETLSGAAKDDVGARERFLRIMGEQAARMTRLVDDLLLLSRVEMRSHLQPTSMADLNLVANDAARQVRQAAADAEIVVTSSVSEGAAKVRGDHDELVQAVQNLIQNAVKYGKPGGRVDVLVGEGRGRRGREVRIAVRDEGPGIAPEHVPRLTERFYRVSTNESREKGGTGLGLAIVKHIVTRHAGSIDIQSEVGKGSMFTIAIPAAA
jgi:two-component system phosphate regulon sensor histidine kinase PhoR